MSVNPYLTKITGNIVVPREVRATPKLNARFRPHFDTIQPVSPVRHEIERRMRTFDTRPYREVRADVLHTSPEWQLGRAIAKAQAKSRKASR